jgi:hypothetical protein
MTLRSIVTQQAKTWPILIRAVCRTLFQQAMTAKPAFDSALTRFGIVKGALTVIMNAIGAWLLGKSMRRTDGHREKARASPAGPLLTALPCDIDFDMGGSTWRCD